MIWINLNDRPRFSDWKKRRANWSPEQLRRVRRDFAVLNSLGFWTAHGRNNAAWTVLFHRFGCHLSWIWTTPKTLLLKNVEHSRDTEGEIMDILAFEWSLFCRFHGFHKCNIYIYINKNNTLYFCCLHNSMHHLHLPELSGKIESKL